MYHIDDVRHEVGERTRQLRNSSDGVDQRVQHAAGSVRAEQQRGPGRGRRRAGVQRNPERRDVLQVVEVRAPRAPTPVNVAKASILRQESPNRGYKIARLGYLDLSTPFCPYTQRQPRAERRYAEWNAYHISITRVQSPLPSPRNSS
ncbi:hypothetical protein EVAR_101053_1 [Eumeta japonica]|uniref:Uncharacterized protein n=1 Tax=Eumeta variegata TaxID=151549 RepID=A0A4C1TKK9_EUMVA|nr:hypothetical protein EVAR_101053_1 [Eumeta japonica]